MILDDTVQMTWNSNNKKYYTERGYIFTKMYDVFNVKIEDLIIGSSMKIHVKCDVCKKEKMLSYREYTNSISNGGYYTCSQKCSNGKSKQTCLKNYGVDVPLKSKTIMNKTKNTNKQRYGFEFNSQRNEIKERVRKTCLKNLDSEYSFQSKKTKEKIYETNVKKKRWSSYDERSDFHKYCLLVSKYTSENRNELYDKWNGFDYYSDEYIKDNLMFNSNDKSYPTIDHKLSIKYGFDNCIIPKVISDVKNLCITKRSINSSKSHKIEKDFELK